MAARTPQRPAASLRRIVAERHTGRFARLTLDCGHEVAASARHGLRTEGFARCDRCAAGRP